MVHRLLSRASTLLFFGQLLVSPTQAQACDSTTPQTSAVPLTSGHVAFSKVDAFGNSQIWVYNFATPSTPAVEISQNWPELYPLNPTYSPDGKYIAFWAFENNAWNVFVWSSGMAQPINVSQAISGRAQDPKFAPDERSIVFDQDGDIRRAYIGFDDNGHIGVTSVQSITTGGNLNGTYNDAGNPTMSADMKSVLYVRGGAVPQHIYQMILNTQRQLNFATSAGQEQYYPVVRPGDGMVFYTAHGSATHQTDQLYMQNPNLPNGPATSLSFNDPLDDNSDSAPVPGTTYVIYSKDNFTPSCTILGANYSLYLGDYSSGKFWKLSLGFSNTDTDALYGSGYTPY